MTIQAQILDLLRDLQREMDMSILIITHDLGIIAEMADDVAVMYASKVVEYAPVTRAVRQSAAPVHAGPVPLASQARHVQEREARDHPRHGSQPACTFPPAASSIRAARSRRTTAARRSRSLREIAPGHLARCHYAGEVRYE